MSHFETCTLSHKAIGHFALVILHSPTVSVSSRPESILKPGNFTPKWSKNWTGLFLNSCGSFLAFLAFSQQLIYSLLKIANEYINCYENCRNQRKEPTLFRNRLISLSSLTKQCAYSPCVFMLLHFCHFDILIYSLATRTLVDLPVHAAQPLCQLNKVFIMMAPPVLGRTC